MRESVADTWHTGAMSGGTWSCRARVAGALAAAMVLVASGCDQGASPADRQVSRDRSAAADPSAATSSRAPLPTSRGSGECRSGPGRRVTQLPDLTVPAVTVAPVTRDGKTLLAGFTVPAQLVDAGCVIRYDAPGGCLGAVRVTGASIPAAYIPESRVAPGDVPGGGRVAEKVFAAVETSGASAPERFTPQVCQAKRDGKLLTVSRSGIVREGFSRNGLSRPGGVRPGRCGGAGCVPEVRVETVRLPPVRLPDVDIAPARLESRTLPGRRDLDVLAGPDSTAYVAPARVLFDVDQATIRPGAQSALRAIAARIRRTAPGRPLLVEGHTDDRGSAAHGLVLSRRRADAVATWLASHGFRRSRISTRGYGEAVPAVPNTSAANRQKNRRVVINVRRANRR